MLSNKNKEKFIKKYSRYLESVMNFSLSSVPVMKRPVFEIKNDSESWTGKGILHIGTAEMKADDEKELMTWCLYVIGHECQHVLSTTNKSWEYGLNEGFRIICRHISKQVDKKPRLLKKSSDYDRLIEDAQKEGLYVSKESIMELVHFIINSVEDGRIERIRSLKRPGFKNYMIICRGKNWEDNPISEDFYIKGNAISYIYTVLNQVLNLSTMGIYQKNFTTIACNNREMHKLIQELIPYIYNGVKAPTCRKAMENAVQIVNILADDIIKASKTTPLEELLKELIKNALDKTMAADKDYSYSDSRTEETGKNMENEKYSPFGISLDDMLNRKNESEVEPGSDSKNKDDDATNDEFSNNGYDNTDKNSSCSVDIVVNNAEEISGIIISSVMETAKESSETEINSSIKAGYINKKKMPKTLIEEGDKDKTVTDISDINNNYAYDITFEERFRNYVPDENMPMELHGKGNTLKHKIEKIFKNQESPLIRGQKSGTLDVANLYKFPLGQMDLFYKKAETNEFDGCSYFLMDNSGSMGNGQGSKRYHCLRALSVMETAFQKIMPLKIVAFDAYDDTRVKHDVIKNWTEKISLNGSYNYYAHESSGYGNKDGYSIRVAIKELLWRSEEKKILFVLSDGLPSCYAMQNEGEQDVHDAVAYARKNGIEVVSIYFGNNLSETAEDVIIFRKMYERNCIITEPEHISDELIRILKRFCFR